MAYVTRCPYCGSVWLVPDKETADRTPLKCPDCRHSFDATCALLNVPDELFPGRVAVPLFSQRAAPRHHAPSTPSPIPSAPAIVPSAAPIAPTAPTEAGPALDTLAAPGTAPRIKPVVVPPVLESAPEAAPVPSAPPAAETPAEETLPPEPPAPAVEPEPETAAEPAEAPETAQSETAPEPESAPAPTAAAPLEIPAASETTETDQSDEVNEPPVRETPAPQPEPAAAAPIPVVPEPPAPQPAATPAKTPAPETASREAMTLSLMQARRHSPEPKLGNLSGVRLAIEKDRAAAQGVAPQGEAQEKPRPVPAPAPARLKRQHHKKGSAGSLVLALVLLLVLSAVAAVIFNQKVMSVLPQTAPYYNNVCRKVPCPGFYLHDIAAFAVTKTQLRPLDESGNYALEIVVLNGSDTAQAVPHLQIELMDDNDGALLRRTLAPEEFLDKQQQTPSIAPHGQLNVRVNMQTNVTSARCLVTPLYP